MSGSSPPRAPSHLVCSRAVRRADADAQGPMVGMKPWRPPNRGPLPRPSPGRGGLRAIGRRIASVMRPSRRPAASGGLWIGDDAAVVDAAGRRLVLATDAAVAGVHADLAVVGLDDLGWKAADRRGERPRRDGRRPELGARDARSAAADRSRPSRRRRRRGVGGLGLPGRRRRPDDRRPGRRVGLGRRRARRPPGRPSPGPARSAATPSSSPVRSAASAAGLRCAAGRRQPTGRSSAPTGAHRARLAAGQVAPGGRRDGDDRRLRRLLARPPPAGRRVRRRLRPRRRAGGRRAPRSTRRSAAGRTTSWSSPPAIPAASPRRSRRPAYRRRSSSAAASTIRPIGGSAGTTCPGWAGSTRSADRRGGGARRRRASGCGRATARSWRPGSGAVAWSPCRRGCTTCRRGAASATR